MDVCDCERVLVRHPIKSRCGGSGAPDGSVNTDDPKVHLIYNERWQCVGTYRQANGSGVDTYPKEQWVHHAAGLAGWGSSSYIDAVLLRDDHEDDWTEAADATLERRVYYCQNWRADVVALLAENGRILERAWYEPYGTPHGMSPADFSGTSDDTNDHYLVPDGDADADDSFVYLDLFGLSAALSDMTGSSDPGDGEYGRPNGTVDSDDYFYYLDQFAIAVNLGRNVLSAGHDGATASHGAGNLRNRRGVAGYEWDPFVSRYHVRNRVLYPEIGRWTRRDPLGYVDGMGLYEYAMSTPAVALDPMGLTVLECLLFWTDNIIGTTTPTDECRRALYVRVRRCCTRSYDITGFNMSACIDRARRKYKSCCKGCRTTAPVAPLKTPPKCFTANGCGDLSYRECIQCCVDHCHTNDKLDCWENCPPRPGQPFGPRPKTGSVADEDSEDNIDVGGV